jgi:hypothetical protein
MKMLPRILLAFAAVILILGGAMHAAAFKRASAAIAAVNLIPLYANSFRALWLIDSATLFILALLFGVLAFRPRLATRSIVILLALIPAATALLIYNFVGSFFPAHMLITAAIAVFVSGLQFPNA